MFFYVSTDKIRTIVALLMQFFPEKKFKIVFRIFCCFLFKTEKFKEYFEEIQIFQEIRAEG